MQIEGEVVSRKEFRGCRRTAARCNFHPASEWNNPQELRTSVLGIVVLRRHGFEFCQSCDKVVLITLVNDAQDGRFQALQNHLIRPALRWGREGREEV
jgi:hypothetical protein